MDTWHIPPTTDDAFGIAEAAEAIAALVHGLRSALELASSNVLIWEYLESSQSIGRAAIQVRVGPAFFEEFFNSSRGYRAMYRRGRRIGSAANAALIESILLAFRSRLAESVDTVLIEKVGDALQIAGRKAIDRAIFFRSLDPSLAKVWYATSEISSETIRRLSYGISQDEIDVGRSCVWKKVQQDPVDCIIEVKGAFVAPCGLFQIKDPEVRATGLSTTGSA